MAKIEDDELRKSIVQLYGQEFLDNIEKGGDVEEEKEEETEKEEDKEVEKTEEKMEKSIIGDDLVKSLQDSLEKTTQLNERLLKSLTEMNEKVQNLEKSVNEFGDQAIPRQTVTNLSYLEKAMKGETSSDEDGRRVLSVSVEKSLVSAALESAWENAKDEDLKKSYESSIEQYVGGNGSIGFEVAQDLYKNHNIRLKQ